ncbi:DNA methyltransferase [Dactylococcopsis salina]|uniref:site-specific DNA-methyltransferase (adenine-specific) n=1 Tax=Dactylococcopsis salina (strain PCC 8305) TaxID=13035 RepID=K9YQ13_DACS8|nr:DNA methyltransferase [Dactylococcopsis salina]AFZ49021.1 N-6 DNA Methylase [Dactylococcopsis salina PCC 8305]
MSATLETVQTFINFCSQYIEGKEKQDAQTFLDRFFRVFGYKGALEAGAKYEQAIRKGSKQGKTGFADLVWKPRVLIEMKKRGEDLGKHYSQAFEYWLRLIPDRPRYVVLCNFDEFWIYDFNQQLDEPVDRVFLTQLWERITAFGFMEVAAQTPVFRNNQVEITETAARRMGELFKILYQRGDKEGFDRLSAQRFILQCVLAMFAEDRGLLPRDQFISCVQDCLNGESSYDLIGGLFREMNQPRITPAGRYQGVDYFNGGLFKTIHPIELTKPELNYLDVAARQDWNKIRPAIFGNIFEGTADENERHSYGIHYTSEADIMKIVRPTISRYWEEKIDAANTIKDLTKLQLELQSYRILDPACGSGNFLYIAYQELKRIEKTLLEKIDRKRRKPTQQTEMGLVTPKQFYGIDSNPFAVELARVTLMIARKVAIDKFNSSEPSLPLDTLDQNIVCQDALFCNWTKADAIIGNPPFLGGKQLRMTLGDNYAEKVFQQFPEVRDSVDFCCYWFRLAHDYLEEKGRVGLVGTNSISQGKSRQASLDYITQNQGFIYEAVSTQPWSGTAKVHVSIVNWSREKPSQFILDDERVNRISSSLKASINVSDAIRLEKNKGMSFQGIIPVGKGFYITKEKAEEWIKENPKNKAVIKLSCSAGDLTDKPNGYPSRWIIDFNDMSLEEASNYALPFKHIKATVKPEREKNRDAKAREYWWRFLRARPKMRKQIADLSCYFAVPSHSKWFIFLPINQQWIPNNSTTIVASDDFYVLGILTSNVHRQWVKAQSSTLKGDTRYTPKTCFETFPFPENPSTEIMENIRQTTIKLHEYRSEQMEQKQWGITKLYNQFFHEPSSQLYQLHEQLNKQVMEAYQFNPKKDILEQILALNLKQSQPDN